MLIMGYLLQHYLDESDIDAPIRQQCLDHMPEPFSGPAPSLLLDQESSSDWMKHHHQSNLQASRCFLVFQVVKR